MEVSCGQIQLKFILPLWSAYSKSSTGGVWILNGVAVFKKVNTSCMNSENWLHQGLLWLYRIFYDLNFGGTDFTVFIQIVCIVYCLYRYLGTWNVQILFSRIHKFNWNKCGCLKVMIFFACNEDILLNSINNQNWKKSYLRYISGVVLKFKKKDNQFVNIYVCSYFAWLDARP